MVERRLYGYTELLQETAPQRIQSWVQTIVSRVDKYGKWHPFVRTGEDEEGCVSRSGIPQAPQSSIDGVLVEQVSHTNTAPVGPQLVGLTAWNALDMPKTLAGLGFNEAQQQAAAVSVINRLTDPAHEYRLNEWFEHTGLGELLGQGSQRGVQSDDRYYRVSDRLLEKKEALEHHLQGKQQEIFSLDRTILLYDVTNTHFEGAGEQNPKAARGHNKQKRDDCVQISVGMVFDEHGFELAHRVFEGNKHDAKTLVEMIEELEALVDRTSLFASASKPLVIVDAGIATRGNLGLLRKRGFNYLVNDSRRGRGRYAAEFAAEDFVIVQNRDTQRAVLIKSIEETSKSAPADEAQSSAGECYTERVVLCKSQERKAKEAAILSQAEQRFVAELQKLASRVAKGLLVDEEKIQRSIGRILGRHPRVQRYYTVELKKDTSHGEESPQAVLSYQRNDAAGDQADALAGCYVLRTDRMECTDQQLWHLYMTLTKAEDGFRALKSTLGLRPNPHHREGRVDGHVFISILAYHLLRFITYSLEQKGDHRSWETIRRVLQTHCYTTILLPTKNGTVYRIRRAGEPEECQKSMYRMLGIEWRNLPVIRMEIMTKNKSIS